MTYEFQHITYSQGWEYKEATNIRDSLKGYAVLDTNKWISMNNF